MKSTYSQQIIDYRSLITDYLLPIFFASYLILSLQACSTSNDPAKQPAKYYLTKIELPGGMEDRIQYSDDTTISQIDIYYQGSLLRTNKFQWNMDRSMIIFTNSPTGVLTETRKISFTGKTISEIAVASTPSALGPSDRYTFTFFMDQQKRLSYYTDVTEMYNYPKVVERGEVSWRSDGLDLTIKDYTGKPTGVYTVNTAGASETSPWVKLKPEVMGSVSIDQLHILHFFVSNTITSIGAYTYDQQVNDANGNVLSIRRNSTSNGSVEFFRFTWKSVAM